MYASEEIREILCAHIFYLKIIISLVGTLEAYANKLYRMTYRIIFTLSNTFSSLCSMYILFICVYTWKVILKDKVILKF